MDEIVKKEEAQLTTVAQFVSAANEHIASAAQLISEAMRNASETEMPLIRTWALKGKESFEAFDKSTRESVLEVLKTKGRRVTAAGTLELDVGNGMVQRAVPTKTTPDDKLTEKALKDASLPTSECMDATVIYKVNPVKFAEFEKRYPDLAKKCYKEVSYRVGKISAKGENDE